MLKGGGKDENKVAYKNLNAIFNSLHNAANSFCALVPVSELTSL